MAMIEGGNFLCYKDGFTTESIDEWNKHCSKEEGSSTHITEEGSTTCVLCHTEIEFKELPFHPLKPDGSKGIALKCESCEQKTVGKVKRSTKK